MMKTILVAWLGATFFAYSANMTDFDGDGMPDVWEAAFGLRTNSAAGIDGAYGDPDGDGLPNIAEYRAGYTVLGANLYSNYTWAVSGLTPTNPYSAGGPLADYWHVAGSNKVHLGWMFTDHDFVDSSWEAVTSNRASMHMPDENNLYGGWNAWERCRISSAKVSPAVDLTLTYIGPRNVGVVTVSAFSDLTAPADVVYRVSGYNRTHALTNIVSGSLKRSSVYWLAVPGTGAWTQGDPVGVLVSQPMSWDRTRLSIELLPTSGDLFTMTLPTPTFGGTGIAPTRVRLRRTTVDGLSNYQAILVDKSYKQEKLLSLLDLNALPLDWNLPGVPIPTVSRDMAVYDVFFGDALILSNNFLALTFTNRFDTTQAKAVSVSPIDGAYVYSSRPVFRWSMAAGYNAFAIEVRSGANTLYSSGETLAPPKDPDTGEYVWEAPIFAGNKIGEYTLNPNTIYSWRVIALNSKFTLSVTGATDSNWSSWKQYRWDVNSPMASSGYGELKALVKYRGPATNLSSRVVAQAHTHRGFCGTPVAEYTLTDAALVTMTNSSTSATNIVMRGLTPSAAVGPYYLCAFIDSNGNGIRDTWESWGYANNQGSTDIFPFDPKPFPVAYSVQNTVALIVIENADTDRDWFPDAWEYERCGPTNIFLSLVAPSVEWDGALDTRVNPYLITNGVFRN